MSRPQEKEKAPKPPACTRAKAHRWALDEPSEGKVRGKCRSCKKVWYFPAYVESAEFGIGILRDPLPPRTIVGPHEIYRA